MASTATALRAVAAALRAHRASADRLPPVTRDEVLREASAWDVEPDAYLRVTHLREADEAEREAEHIERYGEPSIPSPSLSRR
ncbi:MAG: hypothetical protein DI534_11925 [Leifsonia xyli]|nr:MAG: hypothetical protein DI534_11925 [Leifsonia xyli]